VDTITVDEEFIQDSISAIRVLSAEPSVDSSRLAIVGHSLGAWGLPYIMKGLGADAAKVKHLVFLAPAGGDFGGLLLRQLQDRLAASPDSVELKDAVANLEAKREEYRKGGTVSGPIMGSPAAYWKDIFGRDPIGLVRGIAMPMLFIRGAKDIQAADQDLQDWRKGLSGRMDATFMTMPGLNHLLVEVEGPSTGAEYFRDGYVAVPVIDAVAAELRR
jgi:pimeloyl-ACP methyl ester carboxylesterase